jgi:hypothetical protein
MITEMLTGDPTEKLGFNPDELRTKYRYERDSSTSGAGPISFFHILEEWRATGRLEGVELR